MGSYQLAGNPPIQVNLRASARARRLTLRISQLDGQVTLTHPKYTPQRDAITFLHQKEEWLRNHLSSAAPVVLVREGIDIPLYGQLHKVVSGPSRHPHINEGQIVVNHARPIAPQVKAVLQTQAREALVAASDKYARISNKAYSGLSLRDTRSRWGSCSAAGRLMYSWRLIMAPPDVLDYVAAHEVAHLTEMNHQPAFWQLVDRMCPDYRIHRTWLRLHGTKLHRFLFTD